MTIKLIIFDWSGVISDDRTPVYRANMKILKEYGKKTILYREWLAEATIGPREFFKKHGIKDNPNKLFKLYTSCFNDEIKSGAKPKIYPNIHKSLQYLQKKGLKMAVLSSHPENNLKKEIIEYNLLPFFDLILGSSKNKTKDIKKICKLLSKKHKHTLYVGDTTHDIKAAKKARVFSAGVCWGYHPKSMLIKEKPNLLVKELSKLYKLL